MKRKKWSELEEQTLLSKYSELLNSGTLIKLKTREKKFKPIADHVNSVHHLRNPINFPFRWSWRDVSVKVQNMRHQYLGVKQKIRSSDGDFHWSDGEHHWENFLKYKEVFGDVELEVKGKKSGQDFSGEEEEDGLGLGLGFEIDSDDDLMDSDRESRSDEISGSKRRWKKKMKKKKRKKSGGHWGRSKKLGALSAEVMEIREAMLRREERRREREWRKEEEGSGSMEIEEKKMESNLREEEMEMMESELQVWRRKELERRYRIERELTEERRRRMEVEDKWEEEEMAWREKMIGMQIHHEKQMAQMQAESCQNQNQILGIMARLLSQFFIGGGGGGGSTSDGPVLHHHHHHQGGSLGEEEGDHHQKPETNSPSEFFVTK